jgi:hypothetical protein
MVLKSPYLSHVWLGKVTVKKVSGISRFLVRQKIGQFPFWGHSPWGEMT